MTTFATFLVVAIKVETYELQFSERESHHLSSSKDDGTDREGAT
jgi:hypothetical protein